ncbi:MAG: DMT family transporter [Candidatus Paceibacterota bacterium]
MQIWIIVAIFAHFLNAITAITDKHIVSNKVMKPVVYAFYSGVFQILYLLAIPIIAIVWPEMAFHFPSWGLFGLAVFGGALFVFTLTVFYKAISLSEISRVTPIVGVSVPIFTYILSFFLLGETLSSRQMVAFGLFVVGGFLMSAKISRGRITQMRGLALAVLSGFMFASYYVIMDFLFSQIEFFNVFMIIQFGGFLGAILLLLSSQNRRDISKMKDEDNDIIENRGSAIIFILDKAAAALSALLLTYAISIGNVIIINSLQATQYIFTLIIAVVLSRKLPEFFHEQTEQNVVVQKSIALIFITFGLLLII